MSRSLKKAPYVEEKLFARVCAMNEKNEKKVLKTWSRSSTIFPEFVGHTIAVHDGRKHVPVYVTEDMVGKRFDMSLIVIEYVVLLTSTQGHVVESFAISKSFHGIDAEHSNNHCVFFAIPENLKEKHIGKK